jgi:hypothetical protein
MNEMNSLSAALMIFSYAPPWRFGYALRVHSSPLSDEGVNTIPVASK